MIIKIEWGHKINEPDLLYHVLGNDYIVYSKIINKQKSLEISPPPLSKKKVYDQKTLFMPLSTYVGNYYSRRGYVIEKYVQLNKKLVLLSLDFSELSDQDLRIVLESIAKNPPISRLFEHMQGFVENQKIEKYKAGYEELSRDIKYISDNIVDYIRNKYPSAQVDENLLQNINRVLHRHLSDSIERIRTKIIDNLYDLFKSPIIIILRRIKIKLESLIAIKPYHGDERYSKRTKNFITNAAISSFIKVLPIDLWQLSNEDALSILVKPKVEYAVVPDTDYDYAIKSISKNKSHKIKSIFIEPNYRLILVIDYTLSNSIKPIKISLNISSLSLILKSKSIKNFVIVLNEVINNVYASVIKEFPQSNLVCSRIAI